MNQSTKIELTQLERNALVEILIAHSLKPNHIERWINVTTNETVEFEDLLAKFIEEE